jgi:polyphosphate kinase 2 (PPK2 family)
MLATVELGRAVDRATCQRSFRSLRHRLQPLQREVHEARIPVAVVLDGWDEAGKGDTIEKLVGRLDPRGYKVHAIHAPMPEEPMPPFLWRFRTRVPGSCEMAIFDRSWCHRVLVDRVEGDAPRWRWQQAYAEINAFERMLADDGAAVLKFRLHISKAEQLRRFRERQRLAFKRFKITDVDWRSREKWGRCREVVADATGRTSTSFAPWTIVEADDKPRWRIKAMRTIAEPIAAGLDRKVPARPPSGG